MTISIFAKWRHIVHYEAEFKLTLTFNVKEIKILNNFNLFDFAIKSLIRNRCIVEEKPRFDNTVLYVLVKIVLSKNRLFSFNEWKIRKRTVRQRRRCPELGKSVSFSSLSVKFLLMLSVTLNQCTFSFFFSSAIVCCLGYIDSFYNIFCPFFDTFFSFA